MGRAKGFARVTKIAEGIYVTIADPSKGPQCLSNGGGKILGTGSCEKILNTTLLRSWLGNISLLRKNLQSRECERAVVRRIFHGFPGFPHGHCPRFPRHTGIIR
jgi:hypothetical protein